MKIRIFLLALSFAVIGGAKAQDFSKYERSVYVSKGDTLPYRILFPENFDPSKKYPMILFLHGAGERGNDNNAQLLHGGDLFLRPDIRSNYPAIVVFPQCPAESYWSNVKFKTDSGKREFVFQKNGKPTPALEAAMGLMKRMLDKPYVNKSEVYVGGLSMGGMGTFEILRRERNVFAAAFAICGGDNPKNVKKYKDVPLWVFHGSADSVVPVGFSEAVVDALKDKKASPRFTVYPGVNHNSWDKAFAEPDLIPWLMSNKK